MFEKKHLRKQLGTIVGPQNKHTIVDQGCSWTTPLKNCLDAERTNSDMCDQLWKTVLKIQLQDPQCPNDSGHVMVGTSHS